MRQRETAQTVLGELVACRIGELEDRFGRDLTTLEKVAVCYAITPELLALELIERRRPKAQRISEKEARQWSAV